MHPPPRLWLQPRGGLWLELTLTVPQIYLDSPGKKLSGSSPQRL